MEYGLTIGETINAVEKMHKTTHNAISDDEAEALIRQNSMLSRFKQWGLIRELRKSKVNNQEVC